MISAERLNQIGAGFAATAEEAVQLGCELYSARSRIAELEQMWAEDTRRNGAEKTALEDALEKALLRAQGLSQEDREACLAGEDAARYMSQKQIVPSRERAWADTAAILRRLGGQTT